jgi:membrane-associated phospholipid phosphatase
MFIRKDNTLKWGWITFGALITLALVVFGVLFADALLFGLINNPACNTQVPDTNNGLCMAALLLNKIFSWEILLGASIASVFVFFLYKAFTNEFDFRFAFIKIKNSYVFYVLLSILFACGIGKVLKVIIGRARPIFADPMLFNMFSESNEFHSMPSGHTVVSFAALVMLGMLFPRVKWATWTLAIMIGVSRVYVGAHWVSDVILGAFIGMLCADFAKALLKKINTK